MIEKARKMVNELMRKNTDGHGIDHVERVYQLAMKFAKQEKADEKIVALAALLHDVDDYKFIGNKNIQKLQNARHIMNKLKIDDKTKQAVEDIISKMGYSKYLKGIRPTTLEGQIVSDADMCDALGASGIIRSLLYAISDKGNGRIFDPVVFPKTDIKASEYSANITTHDTDGFINHFFEKLLKLKNLMLTESGKKEAKERHNLMVAFLEQFFKEENALKWQKFLKDYLKKID